MLKKISLAAILIFVTVAFIIGLFTAVTAEVKFKEVKSFALQTLTKDTATVKITVVITNDLPLSGKAENFKAAIFFKDTLIGVSEPVKSIEFPGGTDTEIPVELILFTEKLFSVFTDESDSVEFEIKASARAGWFIFNRDFMVSQSIKFPVKEIINSAGSFVSKDQNIVSVTGAKLAEAKFDTSTVEIELTVRNPFNFQIVVSDYPCSISINGKPSGSGNLKDKVELSTAGDSTAATVTCRLNNLNTFVGVAGTLFQGGLKYQTSGNMTLELFGRPLKVPLTLNGSLVDF